MEIEVVLIPTMVLDQVQIQTRDTLAPEATVAADRVVMVVADLETWATMVEVQVAGTSDRRQC